jgi:hypothetical protein
MDLNSILSKSAKGREEIETRKYKLDQRTRSVLITINGKLTLQELARQFAQMSDFNVLIDKLVQDEFVQEVLDPAARLKQARAELGSLIVASLGPDGESIALKVEAAKTMEDLLAYLESRRSLLDGALKDKAAAFWARVSALTA